MQTNFITFHPISIRMAYEFDSKKWQSLACGPWRWLQVARRLYFFLSEISQDMASPSGLISVGNASWKGVGKWRCIYSVCVCMRVCVANFGNSIEEQFMILWTETNATSIRTIQTHKSRGGIPPPLFRLNSEWGVTRSLSPSVQVQGDSIDFQLTCHCLPERLRWERRNGRKLAGLLAGLQSRRSIHTDTHW